MARPADSFLFGAGVVVVPGALALQIWTVAELDRALAQARRDRDEQLIEILEAFRTAGQRAKAAAPGPIIGPLSRPISDITTGSEYITTQQAADRLHVTVRHVVRLLAAGRLDGHLVRGRWHIEPRSLHSGPASKENS